MCRLWLTEDFFFKFSGDNLGVFVVNTLTARIEQRSMPSTAFLLPYSSFWKDDEVLIYAPATNYTVNDYKRLFDDIEFPDGYQMRLDTQRLIEVSIIFSVGWCQEIFHVWHYGKSKSSNHIHAGLPEV